MPFQPGQSGNPGGVLACANGDGCHYSSPPIITPSDIRLKRDITKLTHLDNGLWLYRFRYLWSDTYYVGVMAQEVERVVPEAVVRGADGYLRVNYARLGLRFVTWDEWLVGQRISPAPVNWSVVEPTLSRH